MRNSNQQFICKNIFLKTNDGDVLKLPIAHGEGRYYADDVDMQKLISNDQVLFRYSDAEGNVSDISNPNGSFNNIAGICNEGRNVFGMMPHPERACSTVLQNSDGKKAFKMMLGEDLLN
jgi:phosphoribosylformylglycinamidine synthase